MPLPSSIVGSCSVPQTIDIDARWTMAYAAGLGDSYPCYFDTTRPGGVIAHPMFPVCVEWQVRGLLISALTAEENARGLHYSQHLTLERPVRASDRVTLTSTVVAVERHRVGALMDTRYDAVDASGAKLWTTFMGGVFRDVEVDGPDRRIDGPNVRRPEVTLDASETIDVRAEAAHVYTECARIWNPVHTDEAFAKAAGLPGIILHGTATLALAVSRIVKDGPERVRAISARFGAMALMPTTLTLESARSNRAVPFEVSTQEGRPAVRHGLVVFR